MSSRRSSASGFGVFLVLVVIVVLLIVANVLTFNAGGCDGGNGMLAQLGSAHLCVGVGLD